MILGMQIAITIMGLIMLIMGKGIGKDAPADWRFRLLGGFMLTLFPVVFVAGMILGIVWMIMHPDTNPDTLGDELKWPAIGIEVGFTLLYALIGFLWDKSLRAKLKQP